MLKAKVCIACVCMVLFATSAMAIDTSLVKDAASMVGVAAKLMSKEQAKKVSVTNSHLKNDVKIEEGGSLGNSGIAIEGKEVEINDSTIDNQVQIKQGASIGNSGISASGEKIEIKSSTLENKVTIEKGISVGNSGIKLGQ